jgi:hypothetical protein
VGRRIDTGKIVTRKGNQEEVNQTSTVDDFLGRLVKYIPAEIVGLYVASRGVIPREASASPYWAVAALSWIFVPIYMWFATSRQGQSPLKVQILLATLAFPIWVFAIGGLPVEDLHWYQGHQYVASIVLMFATVAFGRIAPSEGT